MTEFYAQPFSMDHAGFYFSSYEAYQNGMNRLYAGGCEEVEIQFIDGEPYHAALFNAANIGQGGIALWFDALENLDESETAQLCALLDMGYVLRDALERYDEVCLYHGSIKDYAQDLIEETTEIPETLRFYIDYEAIARDMLAGGEIIEIKHDLLFTNAHDF